MGIFDFIKDAGAKIGIGESTAEAEAREAAAEAAEEAARQAEIAKREAEGRARMEMARKRAAAEEEAEAKAEAEKKKAERAARLQERRSEAKRSNQLEGYVKKLGLHVEDLDIRFDDGTAYIEGTVASQEDKERLVLAIGNTAGVEKVDEEIEVVEKGAEAQTYTVVKGDTLSKIAKEFYGDAMKYPEIFEANRPMLKDPDLIYPGQVLRIPALSE